MRLMTIHLAINTAATLILMYLTIPDDVPFIAPMSEQSFVLRYAVIAVVVAFLQVCAQLGIRAADKEAKSNED